MGFIVKPEGRWPEGKIYYLPTEPTTRPQNAPFLAIIEKAMKRWENFVNAEQKRIEFIRVTQDELRLRNIVDYVRVECLVSTSRTDAGGVGRMNGIKVGGMIKFAVAQTGMRNVPHELGHILGLGHEHMREEAGLTPKLERGNTPSLTMKQERAKCAPHRAYDPASIMHYQGDAISADFDGTQTWGKDVRPQPRPEAVEEESWTPSWGDIHAVREMYPARGA